MEVALHQTVERSNSAEPSRPWCWTHAYLACGALPKVADADVGLASQLQGIASASSLRDLGAERRRDGLEVELDRAEVHWHLSALASIQVVAEALVHELVDGEPAPTGQVHKEC